MNSCNPFWDSGAISLECPRFRSVLFTNFQSNNNQGIKILLNISGRSELIFLPTPVLNLDLLSGSFWFLQSGPPKFLSLNFQLVILALPPVPTEGVHPFNSAFLQWLQQASLCIVARTSLSFVLSTYPVSSRLLSLREHVLTGMCITVSPKNTFLWCHVIQKFGGRDLLMHYPTLIFLIIPRLPKLYTSVEIM